MMQSGDEYPEVRFRSNGQQLIRSDPNRCRARMKSTRVYAVLDYESSEICSYYRTEHVMTSFEFNDISQESIGSRLGLDTTIETLVDFMNRCEVVFDADVVVHKCASFRLTNIRLVSSSI